MLNPPGFIDNCWKEKKRPKNAESSTPSKRPTQPEWQILGSAETASRFLINYWDLRNLFYVLYTTTTSYLRPIV